MSRSTFGISGRTSGLESGRTTPSSAITTIGAVLAALEDADASAQEAALRRACSLCHRSLWTVVAATDAGLLGRVLALLDAERLDASERAGDGRLAAALHLIELLAAHAIDANALRALLALFTRGGTVLLLQALSHAVELSKAAGAKHGPDSAAVSCEPTPVSYTHLTLPTTPYV